MTAATKTKLHASVTFDPGGVVLASDQVVGVTRTGDGAYTVDLLEAVGYGEVCVSATISAPAGGPYTAYYVVAALTNVPSQLNVRTYNTAGVAEDAPVNLVVYRIFG